MLACPADPHTSESPLPELPVIVASNVLAAATRLLRWRLILYVLLLAAAAALAVGEHFRPSPAPTNSASPVVDPD